MSTLSATFLNKHTPSQHNRLWCLAAPFYPATLRHLYRILPLWCLAAPFCLASPQVWRQLWRVVERSDVLVQIVDARNPTMFRCPDLEAYVREVGPLKETLLVVNKADYLSPLQVRRGL